MSSQLTNIIIFFCISLRTVAGALVSHGWEERGRQLALVAEDKLRLLSLAKSKISAIISNISTEIWSDVDELKTGFFSPFFSYFNQSIQRLVREARIRNMSAKLIT